MSQIDRLEPEFVEFVPSEDLLEPGKLYISMTYATVVHLCASGCGRKVVLPLSPAKWQLQFDGEAITLFPSVGNWDLPCRSHYWIRDNRIDWAEEWSPEDVAAGRENDERAVDAHYAKNAAPKRRSFWDWLFRRK